MAATELMRAVTTPAGRSSNHGPVDAGGRNDVAPPAVVINEALELARTFSTEESVKFINGMLDAIRKKLDASV